MQELKTELRDLNQNSDWFSLKECTSFLGNRCFSRPIAAISRDVRTSTLISTQIVSETKYASLRLCQIASLVLVVDTFPQQVFKIQGKNRFEQD